MLLLTFTQGPGARFRAADLSPDVHNRGQASTEYVAILLVVAATLAGVATLAAVDPGVGERVVRSVRTGLCVVGGDVCRSSDAAAAGLDPCVTSQRSRRQDTTLDLAVVRVGGHGEWQLALRSDGQAVVTRLEENEFGGTVGVGLTFSPAGVSAAASAALVAGYRGGSAWRFPDARTASAFLAAASATRPSGTRASRTCAGTRSAIAPPAKRRSRSPISVAPD